MVDNTNLSFDRLLEMVADKISRRLSQEPSRLYPRLMTISQAAIYLGRSQRSMKQLTSAGGISPIHIKGRIFWDRFDLDRWIEQRKERSLEANH